MKLAGTRTTLVLTVALLTGFSSTEGIASDQSVTGSAAATAEDIRDVTGKGPWERAACIGCATLIVAAGGLGSVAGMIAMLAQPQIVIACAAGCTRAFS